MILHCEKCQTQYTVPDTAIGINGKTVRCANCGHSWFQAAIDTIQEPEKKPVRPVPVPNVPVPALAPQPAKKQSLPPDSNLPVVVIFNGAPRWLQLICAVLAILVLVLTPFAYRKSILHSEFAFILEPFGIYYTDDLALADVELTKTALSGNVFHVTISCSIINEAKGSRTMPQVRITLFDGNDHKVKKSSNLAKSGENMISGAMVPCAPFAFDTKEDEIETARIDLADSFNLALRK